MIVAISLLVLQAMPAVAFVCVESVNPHGNVIPGVNYPTPDGTDSNRPHNPDGFTTIGYGDPPPGSIVEVWYGDKNNKLVWGPYDLGLTVKWTQIPGSDYEIKDIGSFDAKGGQAEAVAYHFIVPGEPWCSVKVNGIWWYSGPCLVPPPDM